MILVDSSSWIHFLRPDGDRNVRARVVRALNEGEACWCPMVRLELWNGAGGERERSVLRQFERVIPDLPIDAAVWAHANHLARAARRASGRSAAAIVSSVQSARIHQQKMRDRAYAAQQGADFARSGSARSPLAVRTGDNNASVLQPRQVLIQPAVVQ